MDDEDLTILDKFPFLSYITYNDTSYLGIISNSDDLLTTVYIFSELDNEEMKHLFLALGYEWIWKTKREFPINIVLNQKWSIIKGTKKTFNTKVLKVEKGPSITLDTSISKRIKRKQINLIKKID